MTCDRCYQSLWAGEHGVGLCPLEKRQGSHAVTQDTIDFWADTAFREPRHFTSQQAYEKALDDAGLQLNPHYVPGSRHLSNWATIDPYTLENGRILVSRASKATADPVVQVPVTWTHRVLPGSFRVRAEQ